MSVYVDQLAKIDGAAPWCAAALRRTLLKKRRIDSAGGCWLWMGAFYSHKLGAFRYGAIRINRKQHRVHKIAAYAFLGIELSPQIHVCHRCDRPLCFSPAHLFASDHAGNMADKTAKGRQASGERSNKTHLTAKDVETIRARRAAGEKCEAIGADYGITRGAVSRISRGVRWPST